MIYDIISEPKGLEYRALLEAMFEIADSWGFVERPDYPKTSTLSSLLAELEPDIVEITITHEWPGTSLLGGSGVFMYRLRPQKAGLAACLRYTNSLFQWLAPEFPEDIHFVRDDIVVLMTVAHEREAQIELRDDIPIIQSMLAKKLIQPVIERT